MFGLLGCLVVYLVVCLFYWPFIGVGMVGGTGGNSKLIEIIHIRAGIYHDIIHISYHHGT
jgi:hypothetical protein